ncbi:hypothetical protein Cni_G18158 [Canna indica]|uniref:Uncharacterized protein n=1 Tax=Canna indica TaxID=4628 RepID=A0AAQ3QIG0_9LILI|nr:hypothetical protein Cni_G18158 [Canna indica]
MLPSRFLSLLLFMLLISFSFSQGYGRKVIIRDLSETESGVWEGREMVEMVMDYKEPGANTNPRAGLPPSPTKP